MRQPPSIHPCPGSPFPESPGVAEALLRSILGALEPVVIRLDEDFKVRFISRIAVEFDLENVIGTDGLAFVDERFHPAALACWKAALEGQRGFIRTENTAPSGVRRSYETWVGPYDGPDGRGVTLIAVEVTPYREQERMLLETEASLRMAQEATGMGLWSWDLATQRVRWNSQMEAISGQTEALMLSDYIDKLVHPDDRDRVRSSTQEFLDQPRFSTAPYRILRADGTTRMVRTLGTLLRDENDQLTGIVGGTLDVTAEYQREEVARQSQRLESIGQLTAGIAHNFNNLLAGVIPTLQLLAPSAPPRLRLLADDTLRSAVRAAEIIAQLNHYARQGEGQLLSATGVAEPLGRAVRLCLGLFDPSVEIVEDIDPSPLYVSVGDAELEQAIVNLLLNARDALARTPSPRIQVSATRAIPPMELGWLPSHPELGAIRVTVADNGPGMNEETRRRVFDPFFTTKEAGRGTGLGLATVEATVRRVGGAVRCLSREGEGAAFELWLPARAGFAPELDAPSIPIVPAEGQLVLIVDDEQAIRTTTAILLEEGGFRAVSSSSCAEALAEAKKHPQIAAVLLDRSLPDGRGTDIIGPLRSHLPHAAIILHTGHAILPEDRSRVDEVLEKPAMQGRLLEVIGRLVRASRATPSP